MITKLRTLLTRRDKQFLLVLLVFSIAISLVEIVGISVVMPFIAVSADFSLIHSNQYYKALYEYFDFSSDSFFVVIFGVVLIGFYIFRSIVNLLYVYALNRFTQGRYHLLAYRLFENYMGLPYKEFTKRNSSTLTKSILTEASNLTTLISSVLFMISEFFIVILLYALMLYVNYKITFLLTVILLINAIFMMKTVSKSIKKAGVIRAEFQKNFFEIINRSFGNFKLLKLSNHDDKILAEFAKSSYGYANSNISNATLSQIPRLFLEAVGFGLIVFIITYLVYKHDSDISGALPIISMFVLSLYRLMPSVNRIMTSYNQIMFSYESLNIIHSDLTYSTETLGEKQIEFTKEICLSNIHFAYEVDKPLLKNININIKKGSNIAFIGESGSGKSTLVDLIIGLYKPQNGIVKIDNNKLDDSCIKSWRTKVGYIPQSVYLFDGTVAQNIAFGNKIDNDRVVEVLKLANIYEFLQTKEGIDTNVGEGGVMLSGGQKQRLAIARALYTDPEILVLDEATSALDNETEAMIMDEIYKVSFDKTLIIIAHRLSTIDRCEKRYKLENTEIVNG